MNRIQSILLVIFVLSILGCQGATEVKEKNDYGLYPIKQQDTLIPPPQFTEPLVAMDSWAGESVVYLDKRQHRFPSGQVEVAFTLRNPHQSPGVWLEWKVVFYDADNYLLEETEWYATYFPINEIVTLKQNSIGTRVVDYTVLVRTPPQDLPSKNKKD